MIFMHNCHYFRQLQYMAQKQTLHIVEQDGRSRATLARLAIGAGFHGEIYEDIHELIDAAPSAGVVMMNDSGPCSAVPHLMRQLAALGLWCPVIAFCETPTVDKVVDAMKGGALSYIGTPREQDALRVLVTAVADEGDRRRDLLMRAARAHQSLARLTQRERQVLEGILSGDSSKAIARELDISPRTVEIHRMKMLGKLGARNAVEAVKLMVEAASYPSMAA
jgi:FixJ family two-component response regulator